LLQNQFERPAAVETRLPVDFFLNLLMSTPTAVGAKPPTSPMAAAVATLPKAAECVVNTVDEVLLGRASALGMRACTTHR
jgi:hypothetical protein